MPHPETTLVLRREASDRAICDPQGVPRNIDVKHEEYLKRVFCVKDHGLSYDFFVRKCNPSRDARWGTFAGTPYKKIDL